MATSSDRYKNPPRIRPASAPPAKTQLPPHAPPAKKQPVPAKKTAPKTAGRHMPTTAEIAAVIHLRGEQQRHAAAVAKRNVGVNRFSPAYIRG